MSKSSEDVCAICLGSMDSGKDPLFIAECSHQFHFECIAAPSITDCPMCRCRWRLKPHFTSEQSEQPEQPEQSEDDIEVFQPPSSSNNERRSLDISVVQEQESTSEGSFTLLVTLRAPHVPFEQIRSPVDLVTVLDVSGSMDGQKLELVKKAMSFVIQNLRPQDRLSIVSFSDHSEVNLPLKRMLDEGRTAALAAVRTLSVQGGTHIASGLKTAFYILGSRRQKNPLGSIMLLTDGQDATGNSLSVRAYLPSNRELVVPVHTFGFGADHDPVTMHSVAEATRGSFCYVEAETSIQHAFAQCIGGLLSVVAQDVKVVINASAESGVRIRGLEATLANSTNEYKACVDVGTVYADEHKDFLVTVDVNVPVSGDAMPTLISTGSFRDPDTSQSVMIPSQTHVLSRGEGSSESNARVDVERNRIKAAKAMKSARLLADRGELESAKKVLTGTKRQIKRSRTFRDGDENSRSLALDLEKQIESMDSRERYSSRRGASLSVIMAHASQRAVFSARGRGGMGYSTSAMGAMVGKSRRHHKEIQ